jgi:electron transfer flavoprotein beta subunit
MKIAVCVKVAIDESELKTGPDGSPQLQGATTKVSTFDKNAVEEALKLRAEQGGEVVAFTVGGSDGRKALKEALAMGADRGVHVIREGGELDSLGTARLLASVIAPRGPFDCVICAEGSSDVYTGLVPAMLGELLSLPYVGYARSLQVREGKALAERSLEDSTETVEAQVPFVASVVSEANEPRYPTLIQIMQASKKPVEEVRSGAETAGGGVKVISMKAGSSTRRLRLVEGPPDEAAAKLAGLLEEAGVLPS